MKGFAVSVVEEAALDWLQDLGYAILHGPDIAFGELTAECCDPNYRDVISEKRLTEALSGLKPALPQEAIDEVPSTHWAVN